MTTSRCGNIVVQSWLSIKKFRGTSPDVQKYNGRYNKSQLFDLAGCLWGRFASAVGACCEALNYIEHFGSKPALVLLDLMMPVMDGIEFLHLREASQFLAEIPVIVVPAISEPAAFQGKHLTCVSLGWRIIAN